MVRSLIWDQVGGHDRREAPRHAWECNFATVKDLSVRFRLRGDSAVLHGSYADDGGAFGLLGVTSGPRRGFRL